MTNTYLIYDGNKGLFNDDAVVIAKNATEAVKKYMKGNNISGSVRRDGSNYVRFKVTKFVTKENKRYKSGRSIWYLHLTG